MSGTLIHQTEEGSTQHLTVQYHPQGLWIKKRWAHGRYSSTVEQGMDKKTNIEFEFFNN